MKKIIFILAAIEATFSLRAQTNIDDVLKAVEQNNTTLQALRQTADAQKLENRTGLTLPDPEVGFNYLWGSPSGVGNRKDASVSQSFDIATVSGLKGKVAREKNELVEWQYKSDRMNILLEAKQYCLDLIYYNALLEELAIRLEHAKGIAAGQKERLKSGEGNKLEYNNVMLSLSMLEGEITRMKTERDAVQSQLTRLNGGESVTFTKTEYETIEMPDNFIEWYHVAETKNPVLAYVKQEIEVSRKQLFLNKTMGLPTFSVGYMGEYVVGQRYQGISLGMSIPLWSNKNRVRQAKAAVRAAESRQADAKEQFYGNLEILYQRTSGLKIAAETYRASLVEANNSRLLKTALDEGEISVLDYLVGIGLYYDAVNQALDAERAYQKAYAEMSAVEL